MTDKVLLVMDTSTEQTFILKGLRFPAASPAETERPSSPLHAQHGVSVQVHCLKESVFTKVGTLRSHISKFLKRSSKESFDTKDVERYMLTKARLPQPAASPQDSISSESRRCNAGGLL